MVSTRPTLIPAQGNWVRGRERFWGRETELELVQERIADGANVLLVGQRRLGKTSLMRELAERLADDYLCIFVDFEKASTAADAIVELSIALRDHKRVWTKARELFSNILGKLGTGVDTIKLSELSITLRAGLTAGNWRSKGDELFEILAAADKPALLLMDEVPILVNRLLKGEDLQLTDERIQATAEFMSWLRHNSQKHQDEVRIVLSGSIGLEPVLRQARLTATLNTFTSFELPPWDTATAVGCLDALAAGKSIRYRDGVAEQMVERLGCAIPHHVQMFFGHAYTWCRQHDTDELSAEHIDAIYTNNMLGVRGHAELTHYEDRLRLILGDELLTFAMEMITEAAVKGVLTSAAYQALQAQEDALTSQAANELLRVLEHDGYLERRDDGYVFVSRLVRDWWQARHSFGYVPILDRGEP